MVVAFHFLSSIPTGSLALILPVYDELCRDCLTMKHSAGRCMLRVSTSLNYPRLSLYPHGEGSFKEGQNLGGMVPAYRRLYVQYDQARFEKENTTMEGDPIRMEISSENKHSGK
jgi:hypothetical protein